MHSAKISDQKITKISKHQDGCTGGYGQRRASGSDPGKPRLPGDPFPPSSPREALLDLLITWKGPSQGTPTGDSPRTLTFSIIPGQEAALPKVEV